MEDIGDGIVPWWFVGLAMLTVSLVLIVEYRERSLSVVTVERNLCEEVEYELKDADSAFLTESEVKRIVERCNTLNS